MSLEQRNAVNKLMGETPLNLTGDPAEQRVLFTQVMTAQPLADDVVLTPGSLGGVPTVEIEIAGVSGEQVLLWFHGGWFVMGSPYTAASLSADLARRTGTRVISVDYRLAPEHPYPAALQDALAVYRALLAEGARPEDVVFGGESAGGWIVAATLAALASESLPQPSGGVLFSPLADMTLSGESMRLKDGVDPAFTAAGARVRLADFIGDADPSDPAINPVLADFSGVAPMLIQAGSYEILLDDAVRLAARAAAADVSVSLEVTGGVPHVFQGFAPMLEEGDAAMASAASFVITRLSDSGRGA